MMRDLSPDEHGEFYSFLPGCGVAWGIRISPRLFGLLERAGSGRGRRYRRFYGVIVGNFQCGLWSWRVYEYPPERGPVRVAEDAELIP